MPQTFYIESDEEIISVIGRLRKSSAEENVFVFPKRALVLQSIVNLRLFQREAQKLGKKIVIVSQDEVGTMLAEKAGIETQKYSEDFSKQASHLELEAAEQGPAAAPGAPHSDAIGSSDFYQARTMPQALGGIQAPLQAPPSVTPLRVRNATPEKLTSLNSRRFEGAMVAPGAPQPSAAPPAPAQAMIPSQPSPAPLSSQKSPLQPGRDERLKNFYSGTKSAPLPALPKKTQPMTAVPIAGRKAHMIFILLGGISLLSLIGALLFFFLPKAEVHVTPYQTIRTVDIESDGRTGIAAADDTMLPVRILEKDREIALTVATTGISGGTNQKARGTAVIYNKYSALPQPLVATTRLETADGKLFRLVSGVTVPGMTTAGGAQEPGAIEAEVIADQAGAEYNIGASDFTIPGFKGGPKYEKFSAASTKAMTGGGEGGASDIAVVAAVDIDTAEREAKAKAKEDFLSEIRGELSPDERVLDEQIDIAASVPIAVPQVGTAANAFEYRGVFRVRAFVFSEKAIREKVENAVEKDLGGIRFRPVSVSIAYGDSVPDFAGGAVRLRAHALVTMESDIDRDALRAALLGKDEDGIRQALHDFQTVKKINVVFRPEWFVKSIPDSEDRVTIVVEPGEEGE